MTNAKLITYAIELRDRPDVSREGWRHALTMLAEALLGSEADRCKVYSADGTFAILESPEAALEKRLEGARKIEAHIAEGKDIMDRLQGGIGRMAEAWPCAVLTESEHLGELAPGTVYRDESTGKFWASSGHMDLGPFESKILAVMAWLEQGLGDTHEG